MPGIFGGIGCDPGVYDQLEADFCAAWGSCGRAGDRRWRLGGHAFGGAAAVRASPGGWAMAVDGEASLYEAGAPEEILRVSEGCVELAWSCRGNVALVESEGGVMHLAAEWSGSFPLFYAPFAGGLLFSSRARPLARLVGAGRDPAGIIHFLRTGYTLAGRTAFDGVRRVLPGQSLRFDADTGRLSIREHSRAWAAAAPDADTLAGAADAGWNALRESLRGAFPAGGPAAVMMSGGWDSRTLLAAAHGLDDRPGLRGYSHGDVESRELRLAREICAEMGIACRLEPIDDAVLDLELLRRGFERVENVVFPHWHRAGAVLAASGVRSVTAGVFGEVIGGHYGRTMLLPGRARAVEVARELLSPRRAATPVDAVRGLLRTGPLGHHWYLRRDFEPDGAELGALMNAEIAAAVDRLERRGVTDGDAMVEAFATEHRGTQYINAQVLSCRAYADVALPFAARPTLAVASGIPMRVKIHNRVNRAMLRRHAPRLLRHPLAATLLPASAPMLLQEGSRLIRRAMEGGRWALHARTRGRVPQPHLGWVNFAFLRSGKALRALADDLRCDLWDRREVADRISRIERGEWKGELHPMFDQMAKIYTIDLMLR